MSILDNEGHNPQGLGNTGRPDRVGEIRQLRKALYMSAASCQGGNSSAGRVIAETFGVAFPIKMKDLLAKARFEGFDPVELWPWWERQRKSAGMPSLAGERDDRG